ncbi:NAD-P-binding protein [Lactifluus subvellereus]|nr:NAD-P-binding protein [Lactifluus subvellereus]
MTLVLVTGASGFVGSHVVDQLLQEGYSVRGAVRSHNVTRVSKSYESFGDRFTTTVIDDLVASDLSEAVKGVDAVIHVASPLAHSAAPQVILDTAVSGTTRILDAALAAGVKKLIITASITSLVATHDWQKEITINEKSYNPQMAQDALAPGASGFLVYSVSKGLADLAVRDFKRAHPDLDITTIHPSYTYGPLGRGQVYNNPAASGTNRYVYALINGAPDRPVGGYDPAVRGPPLNVDVRDVARAHVLALKTTTSTSTTAPSGSLSDTPKRFIVSSSRFTWKEAIELLAAARPELKGRLPVITGKEPPVGPFATLDTGATEAGLGLKNYIRWQDTILDTIDDLLRVEKALAAQ